MPLKIKAMLVMDQERRLPLLDVLQSCDIEVLPVCNCDEARRMLEIEPLVQVVVTDARFRDGDWRRVFEIVERGRRRIEVVVCSRMGDPRLWLDVLEQGGYDVLVEPFEHEEDGELSKLPQPEAICAPPPERQIISAMPHALPWLK